MPPKITKPEDFEKRNKTQQLEPDQLETLFKTRLQKLTLLQTT
jgi:hypothetical protein